MAIALRISKSGKRSARRVRRVVSFRFPRINAGASVSTQAFTLRNLINLGEVIVTQRALTAGRTAVVRYQFVNAATGRPVSNAVTVTGNRTVVLPFTLPPGTDRLRITNVGSAPVSVEGTILHF